MEAGVLRRVIAAQCEGGILLVQMSDTATAEALLRALTNRTYIFGSHHWGCTQDLEMQLEKQKT